jgi:hypothetical protein
VRLAPSATQWRVRTQARLCSTCARLMTSAAAAGRPARSAAFLLGARCPTLLPAAAEPKHRLRIRTDLPTLAPAGSALTAGGQKARPTAPARAPQPHCPSLHSANAAVAGRSQPHSASRRQRVWPCAALAVAAVGAPLPPRRTTRPRCRANRHGIEPRCPDLRSAATRRAPQRCRDPRHCTRSPGRTPSASPPAQQQRARREAAAGSAHARAGTHHRAGAFAEVRADFKITSTLPKRNTGNQPDRMSGTTRARDEGTHRGIEGASPRWAARVAERKC